MFKCLAFDLDDTLLDTSKLLIPIATRQLCEAMIEAGLNASLEACIQERNRYHLEHSRKNVYRHLVDHFGLSSLAHPDQVSELGYTVYHRVPVPETLPLAPGVREMLESLQDYHLHLVTAGDIETQTRKIKALNIAGLFHRIWIINPRYGQRKKEVFTEILHLEGCQPGELLSIGNRLDQEIRDAKELHAQTCYVQYGEYETLLPQTPEEVPDYTITQLTDLITTCRLQKQTF